MGVLSVKDRGVVHDAKRLPTHDRSIMAFSEPLRFEIEIEATGPPITGRWRRHGEPAGTFVGWTELFASLDAVVSSSTDPRERDVPSANELKTTAKRSGQSADGQGAARGASQPSDVQ